MKHFLEAAPAGLRVNCTFCGAPAFNLLISETPPKPSGIDGWPHTQRHARSCCYACGRRELHNLNLRDQIAVVEQQL